MKRIIESWRKFALNESLPKSGKVKLYHYSRTKSDTLELDPEFFRTKRSHYSKRDYNVSTFPRVFFYVNPSESESVVTSSSANLYSVEVDSSEIYNLMEDPEGLIAKSKKASQQVSPDFTKIFKSLTLQDKPHPDPKYAQYFTPIRGDEDKRYKGVYYTIHGGDTQVVVWFDKITVNKEESEEK